MSKTVQSLSHRIRALGLNEYDARAFAHLLLRGSATAREVSKEAGVPYGRVYDILDDLQRRRLAKRRLDRTAVWSVSGVERLSALAKRRAAALAQLAREMENLYKAVRKRT